MELRKAKLQDIEKVTKYGLILLKQHSDLDPYFTPIEAVEKVYRKFLEGCVHSADKLLLVAEINGELVGYAAGEIQARSPIFKIAEYGYINDVFVEEEFRKLGIAREFLTALKKWFESKGIKHVELSVLSNNEIGKKTWAKFGFETYEIKKRLEMRKLDLKAG
ncbi:MAG: GNAT family N-acetyltransferase [Bacteroidales bacterium]|jgi:ribosomal protein S18 acetylase RimI-like enzyme|nr:GNAT family N-acetyltransferase [Bacteroidales bacterium]NCU36951.1 GNAT family N-acetyltransferase [Candidatus Falkowbacteria bacterium]MDD2631755.1 GNAT family N-acetyltransferase [Bacteroidales bacterium]MDD3131624.1 GNAT family N-acetyltransferase [Bacteroidales bacterium]MDD3527385.1 GNAT family N-acetyltransferase [Bacteroidales bacterium]